MAKNRTTHEPPADLLGDGIEWDWRDYVPDPQTEREQRAARSAKFHHWLFVALFGYAGLALAWTLIVDYTDVAVAIGHIGGAIAVVVAIYMVDSLLIGRMDAQRSERELEEFLLPHGITVAELNAREWPPRILELFCARYSNELMRNRFSDLCGALGMALAWLQLITLTLIIGAVSWYTFTHSLEVAMLAWSIVAVTLLFWIFQMVLSLLCNLFTGRYPGAAKRARNVIAEISRAQRATLGTNGAAQVR